MLDLEISQIIVQIIAFLVMFWVIKKFGWHILAKVLQERREKIQAEFDDIALQKEEIKTLATGYESKLHAIEEEMHVKIQTAVREGQKMSQEIQTEAQMKAQEMIQKAKIEIESEMSKAKHQIKEEIVMLVILATKKMIQLELDESRQKEVIAQFLDEATL